MRKIRFIAIIIAAMTIISAVPCLSDAYLYSGRRKKINCGVIVVPGASQPVGSGYLTAGDVGDLFYLLDQYISMKPSGWSLENPLAPFTARNPNVNPKADPNYWLINLGGVRDLARMHILYLPVTGVTEFSEQDREKLRRFVDNGGVLWIDNVAGSTAVFNNKFFITEFEFTTATGGNDVAASRHHPLLTTPYWITDQEMWALGSVWSGKRAIKPGYKIPAEFTAAPPSFDILFPVVNSGFGTTAMPTVAANSYGSGRVVATANSLGGGCYLPYPHNLPSLKMAYNILSLSSTWTDPRKSPRRTGSAIDTVGGTELIKIWSLQAADSDLKENSPVIYKNIAFYSDGHNLFALDIMPSEDLDHNGNPDDGLPDTAATLTPFGIGNNGQDVIWVWSPGEKISSPVVASLLNPTETTMTAVEVVMVTTASGKVVALDAFPNVYGILQSVTSSIFTWDMGSPADEPYPPVYVNGWIFACTSDCRIHAYNPVIKLTGGTDYEWVLPHPADTSIGSGAKLKCGPNYGYVKNVESEAVVGMVYWYVSAPSPVGGGNQNDSVFGVPIYIYNDRLKFKSRNNLISIHEVSYKGVSIATTPAIKVRAPGNPTATVNAAQQIELSPGVNSNALVHADYALNYANIRDAAVIRPDRIKIRVPIEPASYPGGGLPVTEIPATPALGPFNSIFLSGTRSGTAEAGGSLYGLMNDGTRQLTKWSYLLASAVDPNRLSGTTSAGMLIPPTIMNSSGMAMVDPQPLASPAVSGEKVFATVTGGDGGPRGALLCFKANPDFTIRVTESAGFGPGGTPIRRPKKLKDEALKRPMMVKLWQPNLLDTSGLSTTPLMDAVPVRPEMIDYDKGTITFPDFDRLKLRGGPGGVTLANVFSPSLPVWVFVDNVEVPIDFTTWGPSKLMGMPPAATLSDAVDLSGWNNLMWYYVVPDHGENEPCSGVHSSPVVIGDTVYFVCDDGYMFALNTETGQNNGCPLDDLRRNVKWNAKIDEGGMPHTGSVSIAGSNGVMLVPGPNGLYAYANTPTLVADSSRLVEVDGAGEVAWSVDSVTWPIVIPQITATALPTNPPANRSGPVNKPKSARYVGGTGEILFANSGANQVCKIDKSGSVGVERFTATNGADTDSTAFIRWMYDKFTDPKRLLRPGQKTTLSSPTDAVLWQENEVGGDGNPYTVIHCVIADSGNHRIVDLVYRFNANGQLVLPAGMSLMQSRDPESGYYLPILNWVSVTETENERFAYNCVQLVPNKEGDGHDIWAAVTNYQTEPAVSGVGGGIVCLRYRVAVAGEYNYAVPDSGKIIAAMDTVNWGGVRPLANPRYFQVIKKLDKTTHILVCDNYGVYKAGPLFGGIPIVTNGLTDQAYRIMERDVVVESTQETVVPTNPLNLNLQATSAMELPNGNWLITNGYSEANRLDSKHSPPDQFGGEVFEYDPVTQKIVWQTPKLVVNGSKVNGVTVVDWDSLKQSIKNSYAPQQPQSAVRQY